MNPRYLFAGALVVLVFTASSRFAKQNNAPLQVSKEAVLKTKLIIQCSPDWKQIDEDGLANDIGVLPGWGNYRLHITTKNDSAQFYFNQGINLYYAFHIIEAMASFKKAQQFDDKNALIYWGQALAYGPNINDFAYAATPEAYAAAQKAVSLMSHCSAREKALIQSMAVRYSSDSTASRDSLNRLYTGEMKKSYRQFKQDPDIAALYADAMMLQHPWDYWKHNGEAQPWTPEILSVLENILTNYPEHPGANHYYIHSVEASSHPKRALASADRLGKLMPGVAHMIHMPSHIYIRSGNYKQGIKVNEMSVKGYNTYFRLFPEVQNNAPLYLIHNLHMQSACAMMRANYEYSYNSALECIHGIDTSLLSLPAPMGNSVQYVYMTNFINNVRFGKWDSILNAAPMQAHYVFANVLWHWARGMAFAGKKQLTEAANELNIMQEKMKAPVMLITLQPFNSPDDAARVAEKILEGIIAEKKMDYKQAVQLLTEAVKNEDDMIYNEPKDWLLPARPYLGNTLLLSGDAVKAEKIFREDLKENPNNHWSLYGLYTALSKQHKTAEAAAIKKQYQKAFNEADIEEGHVVF